MLSSTNEVVYEAMTESLNELLQTIVFNKTTFFMLLLLIALYMLNKTIQIKVRRICRKIFQYAAIIATILTLLTVMDIHSVAFAPILKAVLLLIAIRWSIPLIWKLIKRHRLKRKYSRSGIEEVDSMDGHSFEDFLAVQFRKLGYHCELIGSGGHDYGVDLLIEKNGIVTAVQAKRYSNHVGIKAVQETLSGKTYYNAQKALVVTNNYYTAAAINLAESCDVELWDRDDCISHFRI